MQAKDFVCAPSDGRALYGGLGEPGGKRHPFLQTLQSWNVLVECLRCSVIECIWETFCSAH